MNRQQVPLAHRNDRNDRIHRSYKAFIKVVQLRIHNITLGPEREGSLQAYDKN